MKEPADGDLARKRACSADDATLREGSFSSDLSRPLSCCLAIRPIGLAELRGEFPRRRDRRRWQVSIGWPSRWHQSCALSPTLG